MIIPGADLSPSDVSSIFWFNSARLSLIQASLSLLLSSVLTLLYEDSCASICMVLMVQLWFRSLLGTSREAPCLGAPHGSVLRQKVAFGHRHGYAEVEG